MNRRSTLDPMEMAKLTLLQESLNVRANLSEDEVANQTKASKFRGIDGLSIIFREVWAA